MKKEFLNIEVVNNMNALNRLLANEKKAKELPIKVRWAIKKNISVLSPTVKDFEDLKKELVEELQKEYFTEEKSHIVTGDERFSEDDEVRQVNDEYMEEYEEKVSELNGKLRELLNESNEYEIHTIDLDAFVENLPDDTALEFSDLEILSFMSVE